MEIKQVGDLIPYHKSLQELWDKEEFQPVLAFLSSIRDEALTEFRSADSKSKERILRATFATTKTQFNLAAMLLELPKVVKFAKDQIEQQGKAKLRFVESQETGEI